MDDKTIFDAFQKAKPTLNKGERVELIPGKDSIKVMRVRREEVKN